MESSQRILLDLCSPTQDGLETTTQFHHQNPEVKIIAMSRGSLKSNSPAMVEGTGAVHTLQKSFQPEEILAMIQNALNAA